MMKFSGTAMFLFICILASNCLVNGDFLEDSLDSVKEILVSLSKGEIDQEDLNLAFEDLGIDIDEEDADLMMLDYSHELKEDVVVSKGQSRSKRSVSDPPFDTIDVHLDPIVKIDSTTLTADIVYSPSFSLTHGGSSYTFIIGDKQFYNIKDGKVLSMGCTKCTFTYSGAPEAKVVRTAVVAGQTSDHAFVVQVTLREAVGDKFEHAYFTAWKVSLDAASTPTSLVIDTLDIMDFQVVKSPRLIAPDNSYSRVSLLELGTTNRFLTASFHKLLTENTVDGPHLTILNADRTETPIFNTVLSSQALTGHLKDLKLMKVYGKDEYFLVVINTERMFIFKLEPNTEGSFDISLMQKCASNGGVYLTGDSDSIATTITIVRDDGKARTLIYNNYDSFVEMRYFTLDIAVDTWRQVATNGIVLVSPGTQPQQEMVVFKSTDGELNIMRHVMPGIYESLTLPFGMDSYLEDNPNWEILDIGRYEKNGAYEYYLLMLVDGTTIDYLTVNIQFVTYQIQSLNDASLCLQDLENLLLLDKKLLNDISSLESSLINLDSAETPVNNGILFAKKVTMKGSTTFNNIEITMHSDSGIVYDAIDYTVSTSRLAAAYDKVNKANTDADHIFANVVFADGPYINTKTFSITTPQSVTLSSSRFTTLSATSIGQKKTDDLVHHLLQLEGDQEIACNFEFTKNLKVTGNTHISNTASPDGPVIVPSDFIDVSRSNTIDLAITAGTVKFATNHVQTFEVCTLNSIDLRDILTITEMDVSTTEAPVAVTGSKTIIEDITAVNAEFAFIGTRAFADLSAWYDAIIWKNKNTQTISVNSLNFLNIVSNTGITIPTINSIDVTTDKLNDLFLDKNGNVDTPIVISGNVNFNREVLFDDLTAPLLNNVDPTHYLIDKIDQTIAAQVSLKKLITSGNVVDHINTWKLANAVRVDIPQTINTPIVFIDDIVVNTALTLADSIRLAGVDFSEVGRIKHVYDEVVVSNSLTLEDSDVPIAHITHLGFTVSNFNTNALRDEYLMTDIDQTLPNLVSIVPDVGIKRLVIHSTINGIMLDNVLKTSGDQVVTTSTLKLTGRTKFYQNIVMSQWTTETSDTNNAAINDIKIRDLRDDILCDKSEDSNPINSNANSVLTIDDTVGLIVASYFDVEVVDSFKVGTGTDSETGSIVYKDFRTYAHEVVRLRHTNTFSKLATFTKPLTVTDQISSNVNIEGSDSAVLNGQNVKAFSDSIVKIIGDFTVTTPVTVASLQGVGELAATSTFDGVNLHDSYNSHLIRDKNSEQIVTTSLSGSDFQFTTLNLLPSGGDNTYFNGFNFVDYTATLLTDNNVQGTKVLSGTLTVNGNIIMTGGNHFFGININDVYAKSLFASKAQEVTAVVTAGDITSKSIATHQVNNNEFAFWCFRDEVCKMHPDSTVKLSGITAKFTNGFDFRGQLNSRPVSERITALTTRSLTSINSLSTANKVIFTNPVATGDSVTHLLTNSVRYSTSDQVITGIVTFNQPLNIMGNLDIDSKVITSTASADTVDFVDINTNAAFLNRANTFVSGWTVAAINVGGSLTVDTLVNTDFINTINLQNYMDTILIRSIDSSYTQTMTGDLRLTGGLSVTNIADIKTSIDGINVLDFVTKAGDPRNIFLSETPRLIPLVRLNAASTVSGDVIAGTTTNNPSQAPLYTELDSYFSTVVYAKNSASSPQVLNQALTFSNPITFSTLTADVLNGIDTDKIILRNSETTQVINQDITLSQTQVNIVGKLDTTTVNGIDLTQTEIDILLKDRAETISTRLLTTFSQDVTVSSNTITIVGFPTLISNFIEILEDFSTSLLSYYKTYIIEPLRPTVEEVYVAKRIGSVRAKYFDEVDYTAQWYDNTLAYDILGIDTHQFTNDKYTVKMKLGKNGCDIGVDCQCSETRITTQFGTQTTTYDYDSTVFTYISDDLTLTAVSEYDGTSVDCRDTGHNGDLLVEAVALDGPSLQVTLQGTSAESLGEVYDQVTLAGVFQVLDMDVVKIGNIHLMAVTTGFSENSGSPKLVVYEVQNGVIGTSKTVNLNQNPTSLKTIAFSYEDGGVTFEVAHVFVDDSIDGVDSVHVIEWKWNQNTGQQTMRWGNDIQTLATPMFSAMEAFKSTTSNGAPEMTHLALAYEFKINLLNSAILDILEYNVVDQKYVYSTVAIKHKLMVDTPIMKIEAKQFTDYTILAFSTEHKIQIVNFVPNVGYEEISEYEVSEGLVDWTWFQESLPKTMSNENLSTILYMIKMQDGIRSSEALRVGTEGKITLPDLQYKPDNLGF